MNNRKHHWLLVAMAVVLLSGSLATADYDAGINHLRAGKYLDAAAEFQALVDENPSWADGYQLLGICFLKTDKPSEAEKNFLKAIELDSEKFPFYFNLANSYMAQKKWTKVVSTINNAEKLADDKSKPKLYAMRGNALAQMEKWSQAIPDLELASRTGNDVNTLAQLGKAYFAVGDNSKASTALNQVVKKDPSNADAYRLLAEVHLQMGARGRTEDEKKRNYAAALEHANKLLSLGGSASDARYIVGRAALGAGQYDKAVEALSEVVRQQARNCNAKANLGKAYTALKDWSSALVALGDATSCSPDMAVAWEGKGFVLQKQKRYEEAIDAYEKANRIKPSPVATKGIESCKHNMNVSMHNKDVAQKQAEDAAAEAAELARLAEEERKRQEWLEKQEDD